MNIIFLIGLAILLGGFGGKLFQKLKIPRVVGYIVIGLLLGKSLSGFIGETQLNNLSPLINFTLGIIGFLIGAELKMEVFKRYGWQIYTILLAEGLLAFISVAVVVTLVTDKLYLGLIFGAIASATDPASTVNVLWEYRSRGPLTTTLTSIVALDDGLALILYGLISSFAHSMIVNEQFSLWHSIGSPLLNLFSCLLFGAIAGLFLLRLFLSLKGQRELSLAIILGGIACIVGLSTFLKLDLILSSMIAGMVISNISPRTSESMFETVKEISTSLYILFFIFVGASLNIHVFLKTSVLIIILGYLFARSIGKILGATFGALISRAKKTVVRYTGICLFTQGGVAMGLAMSISNNLSYIGNTGQQIGDIIISVVAATTFVVQLLGPILVRLGIVKAEEAGRNITLEDIMQKYKVKDFMHRDFSAILENATLDKIMETIKERESYHFPVVNKQGRLVGLISLGGLRSVFREYQLDKVVLAEDVAVPLEEVLYQDQPLKQAFDILDKRQIDYLPVLDNESNQRVIGIIEYHHLQEDVNRKLFELQEGLDKN